MNIRRPLTYVCLSFQSEKKTTQITTRAQTTWFPAAGWFYDRVTTFNIHTHSACNVTRCGTPQQFKLNINSCSLCTTVQHGNTSHDTPTRARTRVRRVISCPSPPRFWPPRFSPRSFWWICSISESSLIPRMRTVSASSTSRVCFWTKPTW